ncbi:MAG TPA: helix-turn-helix transcriptional regulator [Chlorobiota bacterium]|nr:helix-turn-helix transcriptional regulator [Chlorobiota bacterium]
MDFKLRLVINLVFGGSGAEFAEFLGVNVSTVHHWMNGRTVRSEYLARLLQHGININWLLDDTWTDINGMFADNAAGTALRATYFGQGTPQSAQVPTSAATTTPAKPATRKGSTKRGPA